MIAPGTGPKPVRRLARPTLFSAMLATLGLAAVLAAQPAATVRSPYLDAVRRYGPGTEREAVLALQALRLTDARIIAPWRRDYPRALALHTRSAT